MKNVRNLLTQRANFHAEIRRFFTDRNVIEVDTPLLANAGNPDPNLGNIQTLDGQFLQTSPEFAMKTLLSKKSGDIYQLSHVFRADEQGIRHKQEFMLLEWYRCGFNHHDLMYEVVDLIRHLIPKFSAFETKIFDYYQLFSDILKIDVERITREELCSICHDKFASDLNLEHDAYLDWLFSFLIQPQLPEQSFVFVTNYPPSQASLARLISIGTRQVAARFELFINGLELCNGFWELNNAHEQAERFAADNQRRRAENLPEIAPDERLITALNQLPDCAGVAVGVDRLFMLALGINDIQQVFPNLH